jgi:hypothetical protein
VFGANQITWRPELQTFQRSFLLSWRMMEDLSPYKATSSEATRNAHGSDVDTGEWGGGTRNAWK